MCFGNQGRKSKNSWRHRKIRYNLKSNVDRVVWESRHRDYSSGHLCLQLCPVGHYDEVMSVVLYRKDLATHVWKCQGYRGWQLVDVSVGLRKLLYLFGIEHGLFFTDPVKLADKATMQPLD